jgi:hypothetical protein
LDLGFDASAPDFSMPPAQDGSSPVADAAGGVDAAAGDLSMPPGKDASSPVADTAVAGDSGGTAPTSGCHCEVARAPGGTNGVVFLALGVPLLLLVRRRPRRARRPLGGPAGDQSPDHY